MYASGEADFESQAGVELAGRAGRFGRGVVQGGADGGEPAWERVVERGAQAGEGLGVGLKAFEVVLVAAARFLVRVEGREVDLLDQVTKNGAIPKGADDVLPLADGGGVGFESEDPAAQRGADAIGRGVRIDARGV